MSCNRWVCRRQSGNESRKRRQREHEVEPPTGAQPWHVSRSLFLSHVGEISEESGDPGPRSTRGRPGGWRTGYDVCSGREIGVVSRFSWLSSAAVRAAGPGDAEAADPGIGSAKAYEGPKIRSAGGTTPRSWALPGVASPDPGRGPAYTGGGASKYRARPYTAGGRGRAAPSKQTGSPNPGGCRPLPRHPAPRGGLGSHRSSPSSAWMTAAKLRLVWLRCW